MYVQYCFFIEIKRKIETLVYGDILRIRHKVFVCEVNERKEQNNEKKLVVNF